MPTACSPQDCTSCTSMIGGRPGLYKYLLKIRAVIPLPPVSVRFRFLSSAFLFSSYTVPPLSTKAPVTSLPFPRSTFCAPSCFPPFQLSPASSVCPPPPLLVTFSLCSLIFPHYNVRARVWVWKCCKFCKFASLPSVFPSFLVFRLLFSYGFLPFSVPIRACEYYNVCVFFLPCPPL